jgi:hypothetical protein
MKNSPNENPDTENRPAQAGAVVRRTFWPYGVILAFVLFISGTIGLVVMACSQKMDLVSSDYYEQEIKFQNHLDQLNRAQDLSANASVVYDTATQSILICLPTAHVHAGVIGNIVLYRPSAAGLDRQLKLELDQEGVQRLATAALVPGLWKVRVSWLSGAKEYLIEQSIVIERPKVQNPTSLNTGGDSGPNSRGSS